MVTDLEIVLKHVTARKEAAGKVDAKCEECTRVKMKAGQICPVCFGAHEIELTAFEEWVLAREQSSQVK